MLTQLNELLARARHAELIDEASRRRRGRSAREARPSDASQLWQALTVRLATSADRQALRRLAELDERAAPSGQVLVGVVMQRPVAALSLEDGSVIADPFTPTADLVELLRLRARQLGFC